MCREPWSAIGDCSLYRSGTVLMVLIAVFGVALLIAVLVWGLAARSVLSTSLLFLVAGALVGDGAFGLIHVTADTPIVAITADLALCASCGGSSPSDASATSRWASPSASPRACWPSTSRPTPSRPVAICARATGGRLDGGTQAAAAV